MSPYVPRKLWQRECFGCCRFLGYGIFHRTLIRFISYLLQSFRKAREDERGGKLLVEGEALVCANDHCFTHQQTRVVEHCGHNLYISQTYASASSHFPAPPSPPLQLMFLPIPRFAAAAAIQPPRWAIRCELFNRHCMPVTA